MCVCVCVERGRRSVDFSFLFGCNVPQTDISILSGFSSAPLLLTSALLLTTDSSSRRVFLILSGLRRAVAIWYQHSRITLLSSLRGCNRWSECV